MFITDTYLSDYDFFIEIIQNGLYPNMIFYSQNGNYIIISPKSKINELKT